ncbi:hypothetical protein F5B20DRAFT_547026 [Whalleya microplaca]|nr:hypothetical protein F5B20DRAFT_547026 [Whalleya microplaca]
MFTVHHLACLAACLLIVFLNDVSNFKSTAVLCMIIAFRTSTTSRKRAIFIATLSSVLSVALYHMQGELHQITGAHGDIYGGFLVLVLFLGTFEEVLFLEESTETQAST